MSFLNTGNSSSAFCCWTSDGGTFSASIDVEFRAGSRLGSVVAAMPATSDSKLSDLQLKFRVAHKAGQSKLLYREETK